MKRLSALQSRSQRTYDSDLKSIENPRYPKPDDDEKVKTAPRQSIEPERDIGVNEVEEAENFCIGTPQKCAGD